MPAPRPPRLDDVEPHDNSMRWRVRSRRKQVDSHLVDLSAYNGVGRCTCKHYQVRIEPLVRDGRNPADAIEAGVLKLEPFHAGPWEGFICYHIFRARCALTDAFIKTLGEAQKAQAARPR